MPAKGQTCLSCNARCCHKIVGYKYPEGLSKLPKSIMLYSHKELLKMGMAEVSIADRGETCKDLTSDGKCGLQHHKPRLCRTYWCHGRLWEPKETRRDY